MENSDNFTRKERLLILYVFLAAAIVCLIFTIKKRKGVYLLVPIALMGIYFVIEIARVPLGFVETIELIFNLK